MSCKSAQSSRSRSRFSKKTRFVGENGTANSLNLNKRQDPRLAPDCAARPAGFQRKDPYLCLCPSNILFDSFHATTNSVC